MTSFFNKDRMLSNGKDISFNWGDDSIIVIKDHLLTSWKVNYRRDAMECGITSEGWKEYFPGPSWIECDISLVGEYGEIRQGDINLDFSKTIENATIIELFNEINKKLNNRKKL